LNRDIVVLCNLKPRIRKVITSAGMLLCARHDNDNKVVSLTAPFECDFGELTTFEGHKVGFIDPGNRASKAFSKVVNDSFVDDQGRATYKGVPL
jgi:tRNA-binding EMAP/Myf-like protein